jgi:phosphotriesterase-related protein
MHEHVFSRSPGLLEAWPHLMDKKGLIERAISTFRELKANGVDTIVDLTTVDLGRDAEMIKAVAEATELNIIMATGIWLEPPRYFQRRDADTIADLFVMDIETGLHPTGARPGVIKLATRDVVDPVNELMLRAGSRAHRRTGVPISTHTNVSTRSGLAQQDVFESEGIDLSRVVIGHSGDSTDLEYLTAIMNRGSFIGMDRFGMDNFLPSPERVETVARLCEMGYADQMVLSHDTNCYTESFSDADKRERMTNWHYLYITQDILPALRARGVAEDQITAMVVDNPRRVFEAQGSY